MALKLDPAYYQRILDGEAHGIYRSAEDALNLEASESGLDPSVKNGIGCVGLNQMCNGTLQAFYKSQKGIPSTSSAFPQLAEEFRQLPASEQQRAIDSLWSYRAKMQGLQNPSARDLYWLNFLPATFFKDAPDTYVIVPHPKLSPGQSAGILKANPALVEKDGTGADVIRVGSLVKFLDRAKQTSVYKEALANLNEVRATVSGPPGPPPDPTPHVTPPDVAPPEGPGPIAGGGASGVTNAGPLALGIGLVIAIAAALWAALKGGH